ncbi:unnamed protein product [Phytomonas sp. Hart1]|nr:unnamed protein product [Phytomonas sp. Hart1]|eukprot:CCW68845.1 unnamed protein product [Phytomonas sp. isolate Hart1]
MPTTFGRHSNSQPALSGATLSNYWEAFRRKVSTTIRTTPPENVQLLEVPPEQSWSDSVNEMVHLTYSQRVAGFLMTLAMGILCIVLSISMAATVVVSPRKFIFFLTLGNFLCFSASIFLVGFTYQIKHMFESKRAMAASFYLFSVVCTLFCAVRLRSSIGCIIFGGVQLASLMWYVLSFIPFARNFLSFIWLSVLYPIIRVFQSTVSKCLSRF